MTNDQILLTSAALEAKIEAIVDLSETFHQKQDMIGSVACILNMVRPLGLEEDFPETERHTGEPGTDQAHRDTIIQEAITKLEAIRQRTEGHRHTGNEFGQPTPQNISDAQVASMAIEQFSNAQAIRALTDFINNQDAHPQIRWSAYGLATGIAIEAGVPVRLEAIGNRTDWHTAGARETIIDLMNSTQNQQGNWRDNLHQAARQICAQYGIDQPSDDMLERPGVVGDVIQLRDPEQRYELTADLMPDIEAFIDGVVFKYRDLTYIKTIREPFPEGFPAPTAAEIAGQYLSRCSHPRKNPGGSPGDTDWDYYTQAGLTALRRAQLQLHSISPDSMAKFVNKIQELLPSGQRDGKTHHGNRHQQGRRPPERPPPRSLPHQRHNRPQQRQQDHQSSQKGRDQHRTVGVSQAPWNTTRQVRNHEAHPRAKDHRPNSKGRQGIRHTRPHSNHHQGRDNTKMSTSCKRGPVPHRR